MECFGEVCNELSKVIADTNYHLHQDTPFDAALERRIKMFYILLLLILRKLPGKLITISLNQAIWARLAMWHAKDLLTLIADYERDVLLLST